MKKLIVASVFATLVAGSAFGRVGETFAEIKARYGEGGPSPMQRQSGAETFIYKKENFQIEVVIHDGKSIWEIIQRIDGDMVITDDEIKTILNLYKEGGRTWFFDRKSKQWERSGKPKYVAYRWPGHEDYLCIKDLAACEELEKKMKGSKGL